MNMRWAVLLGLFWGCLLSCQKPDTTLTPQVSITPSAVTLTCGRSLRFGYQLSNSSSRPMTWMVFEWNGGTVTSDGTYTAPDHPGTFTILASPVGLPEAQGMVRVRVVPKPIGTIAAPDVVRIQEKGLKAEVPAQAETAYRWSIKGGRITTATDGATVMFDAGEGPNLVLKCQITNAAGDVLTSSLELPISPKAKVRIRPNYVVLSAGDTFKFGYDITGRPQHPLRWRVVQPKGGAIDNQGSYTAPDAPGNFTIQVSQSQPAVSEFQGSPSSPDGDDDEATVRVVERPRGTIEVATPLPSGDSWTQACVDQQEGMTYHWEISGGSVVTGQDTSCLQFSMGSSNSVTLMCRISNVAGATLELSKTLEVEPSKR